MREVILVTKYSITQMSIDELTDVSKQLIKAKKHIANRTTQRSNQYA